MKEATNIWSMWKKSVQWDEMALKQKLISLWFSLSFVGLGLGGNDLIVSIIVVANFAASAYFCVKYVPVREED